MSYPEFIISLNGKYYCSLCRPNKHYCRKAYAFQHVNSREHKMNVESRTPVKIEPPKIAIVETKKSLSNEETIQAIVKECLKNDPLIKELKNTIDNQKNEILMLKNKNESLLEKVRIYKEEADKLDKMVSDKKKELYIEIFGEV